MYRKIVVSNKTYEYVIGRSVLKIKGVGIFPKEQVGDYIPDSDNYMITPAHVADIIKFGKKQIKEQKMCKDHNLPVSLHVDPFMDEIYNKQIISPMCEKCLQESRDAI